MLKKVDEAEATRRFEEWIKFNDEKIEAKKLKLEQSQDGELEKRLAAEKKVNDNRLARFAKRNADLAAKLVAEVNAAAKGDEDTSDEEIVQEEEATPKEEEVSVTEDVSKTEDTAKIEEEAEPAEDKPKD